MFFRTFTPGPELAGFVDSLWVYKGFRSPQLKERIFPTGTFEIVFNLRQDELRIYRPGQPDRLRRFSGALVSGPYEGFFLTDTAEEAYVVGVHFRPGGAFPFLGASADELANTHIDLDTFWGPAAAEIRERLCTAQSHTQQVRLLEESLLSRMRRPLEHHPAVALALESLSKFNPGTAVRQLARDAGYSQRRFIDLFRGEVGLKPKLFNRIQRFQRVLEQIHSCAHGNWTQVALSYGYFDQSHLIRDFLAFSGVSPAGYVRRLDDLRKHELHTKFNHLPLSQ